MPGNSLARRRRGGGVARPRTSHIEIGEGLNGLKALIAAHRIRVLDVVVWHEKLGYSPDKIVHQYPTLSLADAYAALSYYWDHREEIASARRRARRGRRYAPNEHERARNETPAPAAWHGVRLGRMGATWLARLSSAVGPRRFRWPEYGDG
ncbi:MAG: DUF433 domain-containing protein [Chloroflexota bacterium]